MLGILVLFGLLIALWRVQQDNLDYLNQQIKALEKDIEKLPTVTNNLELKDKLGLEKDLLLIKKDRVNAQNAVYGTLVQTLGGVFFFVTAYFTWRNVKATEEKQVAERFSKAVEQLQSDKLGVGGIYALERIAKDSKRDYWTIMEVLTSFIRANSPIDTQENLKPISDNIQAALTVIGRRDINQDQEGIKINLSRVNLAEANFNGASFKEVNFRESDLRKITFGEANLSNADLSGANLSEVNPSKSNLPVRKVLFADAILPQANLTKAQLSRADFSRAELHKATLREANFSEAIFITATLIEADLSGANLSQANLRTANLSGTNLNDADLFGANFSKAEGLTPKQVTKAKNWEHATYSKEFYITMESFVMHKALGLFLYYLICLFRILPTEPNTSPVNPSRLLCSMSS